MVEGAAASLRSMAQRSVIGTAFYAWALGITVRASVKYRSVMLSAALGNTDKMSAGAACGPGIYVRHCVIVTFQNRPYAHVQFAEHAATSAGYMVAGVGWEKSGISSGPLCCIAICESMPLSLHA